MTTTTPPSPVELLQLRFALEAELNSPELEHELAQGIQGVQATLCRTLLADLAKKASEFLDVDEKSVSPTDRAKGLFTYAWAISRLGEYDCTSESELPAQLMTALVSFSDAAALLNLPPPPLLELIPSVSRPNSKAVPLKLAPQSAFVGLLLAEWTRCTGTLCFASLLQTTVPESNLAEMLDLMARRNVQALFTPLDESTVDADGALAEAGTVMGNARLISEIMASRDWEPTSEMWQRRIRWATHVADSSFVEASLLASRLIESAALSAKILQSSTTSEVERNHVRRMLEATLRKLVPFEVQQGKALAGLGKIMLQAVREIYLGQPSHAPFREEDDDNEIIVPENELVTETRAILARSVQHLENAYSSFQRTPNGRKMAGRAEQLMLRRLEAVYCMMEELDNDQPAVQLLRETRISRAIFINDRLEALAEIGLTETSEDDEEDAEEKLSEHLDKTKI